MDCEPAHPLPKTGRGGQPEPEGAMAAPERHPLPNWKQASLLRLLGILDGQHPLGGSQPEISSPEETHGTPEKVHWLYTQKTERQGRGR